MLWDNSVDDAFADGSDVFRAKQLETKLGILAATTNVNGVATMQVRPGQCWVTGRYEPTYSELYWNVPVDVGRRGRSV